MGAKDISKTMTLKDNVTSPLKKISAGTVQYKKNLKDLKRTADATWSSIKTGATIAGAAVMGMTGIGVTSGVKMASELENYRITLNTVMKDTQKAGELMQWASKFANITPFDTKEVIEGTVRLQAYGISAQKSMGAIGDMASVMNKGLMQAIEAVADAQTGELERMKEFGLTKAMIQKKSDEMFRGQSVINNKGQITDQKKFNEAMFALMSERFEGGMNKQSKTLKGIMSTITGTWSTAIAEMAGVNAMGEIRDGSLFASIKKDVGGIVELVNSGKMSEWATNFGNGLASMYNGAKSVATTIISIGSYVKDNWSVISPIIYGAVGAFVAYKAILIGAKTYAVALTIATYAQTVAQTGLNVAIRANPLGFIITLVGLAIVAGTLLVKNWQQVKLVLMNAWNGIVGATQWAVNMGINLANTYLKVWKFAFDTIKFIGISIWDLIVEGAEKGIQGVLKPINMIREALGKDAIKVDFSVAKFGAEKPKWDSEFNLIPKVDLGGAKFSDDSIMKQMDKAKEEKEKKRAKSEEALIKALEENAKVTENNTTETAKNTSAVKATLRDKSSSTDIADSFLGRIERHIWST